MAKIWAVAQSPSISLARAKIARLAAAAVVVNSAADAAAAVVAVAAAADVAVINR